MKGGKGSQGRIQGGKGALFPLELRAIKLSKS